MSDAGRIIQTIPKNSREAIVVALNDYKGAQLISARAWVLGPNGQPETPTRNGLNFRPQALRAVIEALEAAEAHAIEEGLLP